MPTSWHLSRDPSVKVFAPSPGGVVSDGRDSQITCRIRWALTLNHSLQLVTPGAQITCHHRRSTAPPHPHHPQHLPVLAQGFRMLCKNGFLPSAKAHIARSPEEFCTSNPEAMSFFFSPECRAGTREGHNRDKEHVTTTKCIVTPTNLSEDYPEKAYGRSKKAYGGMRRLMEGIRGLKGIEVINRLIERNKKAQRLIERNKKDPRKGQ